MEHIAKTNIGNGYVRLTPDVGYKLRNTITGSLHSEEEVKEKIADKFEAVAIVNEEEE